MAAGDRAGTDTVLHTTAADTTAMQTTVIATVDVVATIIEAMTMAVTGVVTRDHVVTGKTITCTVTNHSGPASPIPGTGGHAHRTGTLEIADRLTIQL